MSHIKENSFKHFLITRFNVYVEFFKQNGVNTDVRIQEEWLKKRFRLFEQFCFPSVQSQTNQNFQWIVLFDSKTPDFYKQKIDEYCEYKNFNPEYLEAFDSIETLRRLILKRVGHPYPSHLITTRIDNDDAIGKDYIQQVQDLYQDQKDQYVNFNRGFLWQEGRVYVVDEPSNHFISLIERFEGFRTVYAGAHERLKDTGRILEIKTQPNWIEVIHDSNLVNRARGFRVSNRKICNDFILNLCEPIPRESPIYIFLSQICFYLKSRFKTLYYSVIRSVQ